MREEIFYKGNDVNSAADKEEASSIETTLKNVTKKGKRKI